MAAKKLKWPQIVAIIAPQALKFIAEDFLLSHQVGKQHSVTPRVTMQVGSGNPMITSKTANEVDRLLPKNV